MQETIIDIYLTLPIVILISIVNEKSRKCHSHISQTASGTERKTRQAHKITHTVSTGDNNKQMDQLSSSSEVNNIPNMDNKDDSKTPKRCNKKKAISLMGYGAVRKVRQHLIHHFRMWDLIVLVPDHCLSFYFRMIGSKTTLEK